MSTLGNIILVIEAMREIDNGINYINVIIQKIKILKNKINPNRYSLVRQYSR